MFINHFSLLVYFQLLETHGTLRPYSNLPYDKRTCTLCGEMGDGDNNASARFVPYRLLCCLTSEQEALGQREICS